MTSISRFLVTVPLLFVLVSASMFALIDLAPGDAAGELAGTNASAADIERVRTELGFDRPLVERYGSWLGNAVTGDLGTSLYRDQPVGELILSRLGPTLSIAGASLILMLTFSTLMGVSSAARRGGVFDRAVMVFCAGGLAVPQFFVGLILVVWLALSFPLLPATGYTPFAESPADWAAHIILPALALSWLAVAELTRHVRSAALEVLEQPYILTARAKGLRTVTIVRRHVLRNTGIPVVTVLGTRIAQLLGGTVIIETVFAVPGLGSLTVDSVLQRDLPVVLGVVAFATGSVLLVNSLVDLSYRYLDPRTVKA